ncbi:matrix metalloproteinase-18-like [Pyxicephalus adspersus]|uniref:matrix metalloproteinase-18-like n=1 Tax=Pyxicephalus adspersus TaxID=30357 RepID=UPI003B5B297B
MNPQYLMTDPKGFRLSQNDINAIQHLYGPSPKNPFVKGPSICDPGQDYDAATTVRGDVFFFTDRYVLRRYHNSSEVQMDFIQTYWNFLPNNINAAYENTDSDIVRVFQGIKYWEITEGLNLTSMGSIYHFGFPSHVKFIDAAVFVENNEKTYFFVRKKYWRYNEKTQAMDEGFPRSIAKDFPGVGPRINAAMYFKEKLYLLDNNAQHEISINESGQIAEKIYKSPKSHWVGC